MNQRIFFALLSAFADAPFALPANDNMIDPDPASRAIGDIRSDAVAMLSSAIALPKLKSPSFELSRNRFARTVRPLNLSVMRPR